jgi:hypothetical protein
LSSWSDVHHGIIGKLLTLGLFNMPVTLLNKESIDFPEALKKKEP